jgi:hypothetical protein
VHQPLRDHLAAAGRPAAQDLKAQVRERGQQRPRVFGEPEAGQRRPGHRRVGVAAALGENRGHGLGVMRIPRPEVGLYLR